MDVKLTVTKTLDDNYWGFDDMLDGLDLTAPEEIKAEIIAYIRDADPWTAIDPDDGAIWTVSIDGDAPDWQARAEAAEKRVQELESQLAAQWRPVTEQEPPQGKKVLGKQYIESSPCIVSLEFDPMENDFVWQDVDGVSYFYDSINYWRSIE